jgi:hypothetical protein
MSMLAKVRKSTIVRFLAAFASAPGVLGAPQLLENPIEEIDHAISRGDHLTLHYASAAQARGRSALSDLMAKRGEVIGEENYLHSTRRYPAAQDNVLPAGNHIPKGTYSYFQYAVNDASVGAGFPAGFVSSYNETNLTTKQVIPTGQGFRIWQEQVAFNMQASPDDIEQVLDSGDFQYQTQSNQYTLYKGPFAGWPGGWGVSGFSDVQGQASAHNGIADPRAVKRLQFPRVIKAQQQFTYNHVVGVDGLANRPLIVGVAGVPNIATLSDFVNARVVLWGDQITKMAS